MLVVLVEVEVTPLRRPFVDDNKTFLPGADEQPRAGEGDFIEIGVKQDDLLRLMKKEL